LFLREIKPGYTRSNNSKKLTQHFPPKQKRSKRRKAKSLFKRWKRLSLKHTWSMPLLILVALVGAYYISPGEHNPLYPALHLSYANPALHERTNTLPAHIGNPTQYGKGRKDFAFVAFYTIVFTFTREFCMQRLIRPLAIRAGIKSRGKQARFMEQAYTAMYFAVFGPFGLWVMSRTPVWYFNTAGMYEGFPHRAHEACFKTYYLLQAAYWAQQAIVLMLQLEKPRKDFKELVLHHIITLALIGLSYRFHFTYMGIAVYITHDISDFFLAVSISPCCGRFRRPGPVKANKPIS
jgi:acyl-CoA-dependent ceramide synthase